MQTLRPSADPAKPAKRAEYDRVFEEIEQLCRMGKPGDRLPKHTELMQALSASERTVLHVLDRLHQSGRILRRSGAGTFIAAPETPPESASADGATVIAITQPDNSFFSRCTQLLHRHAKSANLTLLCRLIDRDAETLTVPPFGTNSPVGYVVFRYDLAPLAQQIQAAGHRVVLIGAPPPGETPGFPCIHGDHEQGAYLATHHLLELGHRRLAFAMIADTHLPSIRRLGHQQALQEGEAGGMVLTSTTLSSAEVETWEQDPARAVAYFQKSDAPTGLVVWNDHEAVRLAGALFRAGIRVPEDVSLVGYDNLPEGNLIYPRLTTIDQAIGQQLRLALKLLTQPIPPSHAQTILVTPTLLPRGSSAAPRSHQSENAPLQSRE
jgi:GntR family transcriptional regulator of arabinose operon